MNMSNHTHRDMVDAQSLAPIRFHNYFSMKWKKIFFFRLLLMFVQYLYCAMSFEQFYFDWRKIVERRRKKRQCGNKVREKEWERVDRNNSLNKMGIRSLMAFRSWTLNRGESVQFAVECFSRMSEWLISLFYILVHGQLCICYALCLHPCMPRAAYWSVTLMQLMVKCTSMHRFYVSANN